MDDNIKMDKHMKFQKNFQLTKDLKGIAVWSEDTKLDYSASEGVFFDTNCRERGIDILYDLIDEIMPKKWDKPIYKIKIEIED